MKADISVVITLYNKGKNIEHTVKSTVNEQLSTCRG